MLAALRPHMERAYRYARVIESLRKRARKDAKGGQSAHGR
jgi:hypothetical protein